MVMVMVIVRAVVVVVVVVVIDDADDDGNDDDDDDGDDDDDDDDDGGGGKLAIKGRPAPRARSEAFILLHRSLHSLRPSAFLPIREGAKYCFVDLSSNFLTQFFCNTIFSLFWGKYLRKRPLCLLRKFLLQPLFVVLFRPYHRDSEHLAFGLIDLK